MGRIIPPFLNMNCPQFIELDSFGAARNWYYTMGTQHRLHQISYSCCRITWKFLSTTFTFFLVHMD